jgi:hypothetical protein
LEQTELLARTKELRKAQEEARLARERARAAEEQRIATVKAADAATKSAEEAIAKKRGATQPSDATTLAALPKIEQAAASPNQFDGSWSVSGQGQGCAGPNWQFAFSASNGSISGSHRFGPVRGSVSANGGLHLTHPNSSGQRTAHYNGVIRGSSGGGSVRVVGGKCVGTFTVRRN